MQSKCMKVQTGAKHGTRNPLEAGTLAHQWSIIGATKFSANPHAANASQTRFSSNIGTSLNQASLQRTILSKQSATLHRHCDGGCVLTKLNSILNNNSNAMKRQVTFWDNVPDPRVGAKTQTPPRVLTKEKHPRTGKVGGSTTANKQAHKQAYAKAQSISMPTRSKYARAAAEIIKRRQSPRIWSDSQMTELAQAILDDNPNTSWEYANEIFDDETGKLLKYRKLISHPKYREVWMHSSANEFGRLAQGVGNRIKGTDTIFFIFKHKVPKD